MYQTLLNQIKAISNKDLPLITNLSNISAILNKMNDINWVGFYLVKDNMLYLGPFQGDVACTLIPFGKGVCGNSAQNKKTIVVDNVNNFEGHIACSSLSKSEIVVPILKDNKVFGVIDIDSPIYSRFKDKEKDFIEEVSKIISSLI